MKVKERKKQKFVTSRISGFIRPYLSDMINDHKTQSEWKIQWTMQINFISSKDFEELVSYLYIICLLISYLHRTILKK